MCRIKKSRNLISCLAQSVPEKNVTVHMPHLYRGNQLQFFFFCEKTKKQKTKTKNSSSKTVRGKMKYYVQIDSSRFKLLRKYSLLWGRIWLKIAQAKNLELKVLLQRVFKMFHLYANAHQRTTRNEQCLLTIPFSGFLNSCVIPVDPRHTRIGVSHR